MSVQVDDGRRGNALHSLEEELEQDRVKESGNIERYSALYSENSYRMLYVLALTNSPLS